MKKLWKLPSQTRCPECGAIFATPPATMPKNAFLYVDGKKGTYEVDCPQCGEIITVPLDIWE